MKSEVELTARESEVAELLAWGATKKEIANKLFISVRTVENTARNIFQKTGVTKANELSAWWFCTHYSISFDLSPIKRTIIAIALLLIIIPKEFSQERSEMMRTGRRTTQCRTVRSGRRGKEIGFNNL